jgi:AcrR family transcriptional regulator
MAAGIMKHSRRLTREDFQEAMLATVDQGRFDISLNDLCEGLGVTTGSFYSHYPAMTDLHRDFAEVWLEDRTAALAKANAPDDGVREPLDRLREIRAAAAAVAVRDATMRRWAATVSASDTAWAQSIPVVAAKVAELDQVIEDYLTSALTDLGFTGREPADLARWLAAALQVPARARDAEGLETILDVWAIAVAFRPEGPAVAADLAAPDAIRLYTMARRLPPEAQRSLQQVVKLIADARHGDNAPQGHHQATAGQA